MANLDGFVKVIEAMGLDLSPSKKRIIIREDIYSVETNLEAGDHVAVQFGALTKDSPWHHGIYMGEKKVFDFHGID